MANHPDDGNVYIIERNGQSAKVTAEVVTYLGSRAITREPLTHVIVHSPDGFETGYGGSGPADLALSILADHFHERQTVIEATRFENACCPRAWKLHQDFKWHFIAKGAAWGGFRITSREIEDWLDGRTGTQE
jgi:hypothetical protein